jgi:hypothetical protein
MNIHYRVYYKGYTSFIEFSLASDVVDRYELESVMTMAIKHDPHFTGRSVDYSRVARVTRKVKDVWEPRQWIIPRPLQMQESSLAITTDPVLRWPI